ncbi:MAG: alkaline phosphatase [Lutibacter sp.]|nr:MAG: alkaline phosphatase [Lutibacter sp.]
MKYIKTLLILLFIITACKLDQKPTESSTNFTIAFGSCNNQFSPNPFWGEIAKNKPDVWIWGGDIIYSDTDDMTILAQNYLMQKKNIDYANFIKNIDILATWDDHDYGLNDGGAEYIKKEASQQLFLDFIDVSKDDDRRNQKGVYFAKEYTINNKNIKIILLDTRYFRTALTPDIDSEKRYKPTISSDETMLGETQWNWLENQLQNSKASYTVIVSSIQFLSSEHGFESWGNMPNEVTKLEHLISSTNAKNVIILSGDRHLSEFSKKEVANLNYALIDFTSSGLTHSYTDYNDEPNQFRIGDVVSEKSFGLLKFDFKTNTVFMEIRGENNVLLASFTQIY